MSRRHALVFLLMLSLVALYTWPLARDPGHLFPDNPDPRTLTWVMLRVFHNLLAQPGALLHGNAFYPVGLSLTFTEPLVVPALLAGPIHALTGNPVLAHNLTLLVFWALSGWAMYAVTLWLTRDHAAALVAAGVFTLSPYRIGMYLEFQMEILFGIPLAIYTLVRFLETQRARYLWVFGVVFWLQAISVLYYGVILACGLVVVVAQYVALRWTGWRVRTLLGGVTGAGLVAVAMSPVAWPFLVTQRELGFQRSLAEIAERSANVLTYLELRPNRLYHATPAGYFYETSVFLGGVALLLAAIGLLWLRERPGLPRGWAERVLDAAMAAAAILGGLALWPRTRAVLPGAAFSVSGVMLLGLLLARETVTGWRRRRADLAERTLDPQDWAWLLLGLALAAFLLSLGPVVRAAHQTIGPGPYAWLYPVLFPLRGIRAVERIGVLWVFAGALLAGLGVTWLRARLPRPAFRVLLAALVLLMGLEYAEFPLAYGWVAARPRPVDVLLRAAPAGTVVLEWPTFVPLTDADAMLRSTYHGQRIVNGYSGFVPPFLGRLSRALTLSGPPFPAPQAEAALRRLYPLDFLVVRLADPALGAEWRSRWERLHEAPPPYLRARGRYGDEDLWEVAFPAAEGWSHEREVSFDFLRERPLLRITVAPLAAEPDIESSVEILLNARSVARLPVVGRQPLTVRLPPPYRQAAPNVVTLRYAYRRPATALDARFRVGATGSVSPGDLTVRSAGQPYGAVASIAYDGVDVARNRRGYNLAALDPDGRLRAVAVFDTHGDPGAAARLADFVRELPAGTLVAGAVRDEASLRLDGAAVGALRTLGVAGDLRGRFRESHAFVGVKGAAPGAALEALGPRALILTVGQPPGVLGLRFESFALLAPGASR